MSSKIESVRKLLGQCFYIGFAGIEMPKEAADFIKKNHIGGVTLFANNYESPAQTVDLVDSIQSLRSENIPLTIAVDHEGGKVQRFKKNFTRFPEARLIGNLNSPKITYQVAEIMAKELKAVGVNLTYSPVADINTNSKNPVIGSRAYGETEEQVTKMVSAMVRGFISNNLQCVVKHFPGHGDTSQDSHFHLPKVSTPLDVIRKREIKPFLKAFKSHCEVVMSAHILLQDIDPKVPGTLSEKVLQKFLREELDFKGLIISDDMEMKAIADHFGLIDAPLEALKAGVNILLYHTMPVQTEVFEPLLEKLLDPKNKKALKNLEQSAQIAIDFKKRNFMPYQKLNTQESTRIIGCEEHLKFLKELEQKINPDFQRG